MITLHNWEEYAILRADGELDTAQTAALEAFLQKHPELAAEAAVYTSLKLIPDTDVVFEAKESLLRRDPRVVALSGRRWMWAAAACLAIAAGSVLFIQKEKEPRVVTATPDQLQLPAIDTPKSQQPSPALPAAPPRVIAATPAVSSSAAMQRAKQSAGTVAQVTQPRALQRNRVVEEPIQAFTPVNWKPLETSTAPVFEAALRQSSLAVTTPPTNKHPRNVPLLDDSRLQPLQEFAGAAAERIAALRAAREKLRDAEVAVSVGRHELFKISL